MDWDAFDGVRKQFATASGALLLVRVDYQFRPYIQVVVRSRPRPYWILSFVDERNLGGLMKSGWFSKSNAAPLCFSYVNGALFIQRVNEIPDCEFCKLDTHRGGS